MQFTGYWVESLIFKRNYSVKIKNNLELPFQFKTEVFISEEKENSVIKLECKIFDEEFVDNTSPFYIACIIQGNFICEKDSNIENFQTNAVAILIPYLRSTISSFTAQSGIPTVILPLINVQNMFSSEDIQD